jgi:hypothetical protein
MIEYVCSYRIKHSIDHYAYNPLERGDRVILQNIVAAVDLHRKALALVVISLPDILQHPGSQVDNM